MDIEQAVIDKVRESIGTAIASALTGYQNPLQACVTNVIKSRESEIVELVKEAFDQGLKTDFKKELISACTHKLARVLVGKLEGEIEKRANELRSSPEFRAKLTLAIEEAVKSVGASKL